MKRVRTDIPQFSYPSGFDRNLARDLDRLSSAVEDLAEDPALMLFPDTVLASGSATLALDKVTRLKPPKTGDVVLLLPAAAPGMENHFADLIVTERTSASLTVRPPSGATIDGAANVTPYAIGLSRFMFHGGNWYWMH